MSTNFFIKMRFNLIAALLLFFMASPSSVFSQPKDSIKIETIGEKHQKEADEFIDLVQDTTFSANLKAVIKPIRSKTEVELSSRFYISLLANLLALLLIIVIVYYPNYKKLDTVFTFVLFNVSIFLLTSLLNQVKISMGAAFGLFAVFSMLRYRTTGMNVKDMTYLFIFIAMGLLSGIELQLYELVIVFGILFVTILVLDTRILLKRESTKVVVFDDITLIPVQKEKELIEELKRRTGLNVHRVSIEQISYLRDSAKIIIYYYE